MAIQWAAAIWTVGAIGRSGTIPIPSHAIFSRLWQAICAPTATASRPCPDARYSWVSGCAKKICRAQITPDRKSVVEGKSVQVRVALGGRSIIKKKKRTAHNNDLQDTTTN